MAQNELTNNQKKKAEAEDSADSKNTVGRDNRGGFGFGLRPCLCPGTSPSLPWSGIFHDRIWKKYRRT